MSLAKSLNKYYFQYVPNDSSPTKVECWALLFSAVVNIN